MRLLNGELDNNMKNPLKSALAAAALVLAGQAMAQVTFYEGEGFRGRAFTTSERVNDFSRSGFNDRASSVVVGNGRWEVCEDSRFEGRCVVLRKGSYDSLRGLGLENKVSSVRPVLETPMATQLASRMAALVSPLCTSAQVWTLMPMR